MLQLSANCFRWISRLLSYCYVCSKVYDEKAKGKNIKIEMFPLANYSFSGDREKCSPWMNAVKYGRFFVFCRVWHSIRFMMKMSGHPQHLHNLPFWAVTGFLPLFLSIPVILSVDNIAATIELPQASKYLPTFVAIVVLYRIYHLTISVIFNISGVAITNHLFMSAEKWKTN